MTHVAVVGGGPAGLSAALFTAKNGLATTVFDTDDTWLHSAHLFNYLGVNSVDGESFLAVARDQVDDAGAERRQAEVTDVTEADGAFEVSTEAETHVADYVILATGADRDLATALGCETDDDGVVTVDVTMETSVSGAYATGAMVRAEEWQAVISAGDGAAAALNVLTREKGEHFHDFDTPADAEAAMAAVVDEAETDDAD